MDSSAPMSMPNSSQPAAAPASAAEVVDLTGEPAVNPPPCKKPKRTTSVVWNHMTKYEIKVQDKDGNTVVERWAKCNSPGCNYKGRRESGRGTSVFISHLKNNHSIMTGQQRLELKPSGDNDNEKSASVQTYRYDEAASLQKFYLAIIMHEYPMRIVEHKYFIDFVKSLRPSFPIKSRPTVKKEIENMFNEEKKRLYEYFKTLDCRFSTTMDMWTSNQTKGYMCITVHWIDDNWCMQKRIIKFMQVKGHHSGKALCNEFIDSILDWNLDRKLIALSLDNAAANDKCVDGVVSKLNKISPLVCDGIFFHVRCMNHILNLVAQDGLKTIASSIANIRNTVAIVKISTLQHDFFKKCASECGLNENTELKLDVPTRWNSTYEMLCSARYNKEAFERLFLRNKSTYKKCAPSESDWEMAASVCACLKPFYDATVLFSAHKYPTANLFFRKFCLIKLAIAEWCGSSNNVIKRMAFSMRKKYDKYWDKSNMALAVSSFLDPRYKKNVIEFYAPKLYPTTSMQEINKFDMVINQLFQAYLSTSMKTDTNGSTSVHHMASQLDIPGDEDDLDMFLHSKCQSDSGTKSELEIYLEQPLAPRAKDSDFDILSWWKVKQAEFPVLARLAHDVLSIQVSTVASESAFSAGGRVIDPLRNRLEPETVQAFICLKDWTLGKGAKEAKSIMDEMDMESIEQHLANLVLLDDQESGGDSTDGEKDSDEDDMELN